MKSRGAAAAPAVGIVVVNWNGADRTRRCLRSLLALTYPQYRVCLLVGVRPQRPLRTGQLLPSPRGDLSEDRRAGALFSFPPQGPLYYYHARTRALVDFLKRRFGRAPYADEPAIGPEFILERESVT